MGRGREEEGEVDGRGRRARSVGSEGVGGVRRERDETWSRGSGGYPRGTTDEHFDGLAALCRRRRFEAA